MPRYGDDQCANCCGVRVAKSTLCADCLVKERDILGKEVLIKMAVIEVQRKRIANLQGLLKEAMAYGFKQNQENVELYKRIKGLQGKIREVLEDAKNWKRENKER